jgi:hypothetical protein
MYLLVLTKYEFRIRPSAEMYLEIKFFDYETEWEEFFKGS